MLKNKVINCTNKNNKSYPKILIRQTGFENHNVQLLASKFKKKIISSIGT